MLGIDDRELGETGLVHDEVAEFGEVGLFAVDLQGALALGFEARIESPSGEVAAVDGHLLLFDGVHKAALDVLLGAGAVAEDERRSIVGFSLFKGFDRRGGIGAEGNLSDVNVAISHRHEGEVLLGFLLAGSGELVDGAGL